MRVTATGARGRGVLLRRGLVGAVAAVGLAGCGVLELGDGGHEAVVLSVGQPADSQQRTVTVELLQTDIAGQTVVAVGFDEDAVSCGDGRAFDADELTPGTELRFDQGRDSVEQHAPDEPPVVSGVGLEVHCP